jgi:large subunit ribosomal protein L23
LISPVMTEKTFGLSGTHNQYVFKVHEWANKNDVKKAIEDLYGVPVEAVKTLWVARKWRFNRKLTRRAYKKAIIMIDKKHKLEEPKA